jgi:hypothetical protein
VAKSLNDPKAAWMTVCPTPHIMAWDWSMSKLDVLYTKAIEAELTTPSVKGITTPINMIIKE